MITFGYIQKNKLMLWSSFLFFYKNQDKKHTKYFMKYVFNIDLDKI